MPLQFDSSPYLQVWAQKREEEARNRFDPQAANQNILQGLQMMAENRKQQALLDIAKQKEGREQAQFDYEYGKPIDPNIDTGVSVGQNGVSRLFGGLPKGVQGPNRPMATGTGGRLIDAFNSWRAGGMNSNEARPEFMGALGKDERKIFFDKANPEPADLINPSVAKSLGLPDDLIAQYPNGVPREIASLSNSFANRQNRASNQEFGNENQLQTKFLNESKDFKDSATSYQRILDSAENPSAAGDLALIFNYMKMLDPGSTVREGEFANAENSGGLDSRLVAQYNKILSGERLAPEMRADFINRAMQIYQGQESRHGQREAEFKRIAQGYGMDPTRIIVDLRAKPRKVASPGATGAQSAGGVQPKYQRNKATGQMRVSYDGGQTWQLQ